MAGLFAIALIAVGGDVGLGISGLGRPRAQTSPSAEALAFEAAAVRMNRSGSPQGDGKITPGGRYTATNLSLAVLIRFAFERSPRSRGLEPFEVTGGPNWMATDRFDVNATAARQVSLTDLRVMLQTLLIERFRLKTHYEVKQRPVYRMVLARRDTLGPQLHRTVAECASQDVDPLRGINPGHSEPCGYFGPSPTIPLASDKAYQAFRGLTMEDFALRIYPYVGRRVIDATGLAGYFDGDFEFTAEIVMPPPPPGGPNPYDGRVLPSIFSVLPQQLGLRLESGRGPVETLVIDYAEHPTQN